jgi:UDPglucose 6-dehydrogenase
MSPSHPRLRLTVIGAGYLGLTHAVCMAHLGHDVLALDVDENKVARAAQGQAPFFEPGLEPLLRKNLEAGRLRFTNSFAEAGAFGDVHFLCVGTPQAADGSADLSYVYAAADALAPHLSRRCVIAGKSTVPVGTARRLAARIGARIGAHAMAGAAGAYPMAGGGTAEPGGAGEPGEAGPEMAWNPEFLREGFAVQDSLSPDRLVFGVTSQQAAQALRQVYAQPIAQGAAEVVTDLETAELVKVSANAFLATKISFINAMAEVCEAVGADVLSLARALGHDSRIGARFLGPGLGYGGGCLPKDVRAFRATARELGIDSVAAILTEVDAVNLRRRARTVDLARDAAGGSLAGCRVAALGAAFKPNSDDVRDSASLDVCGRMAAEGAIVTVHDPVAIQKAAAVQPALRYANSALAAAADADVVLHLTEWPEYRLIEPDKLGAVVARRNMVDARCVLDGPRWRSAGWSFRLLGGS